jgi:acyl-CoA synthetase (AMP-forming)/AMP-acid ligase II
VLADVVREAGRRFGDRVALAAWDGATVSYLELDRWSDALAGGLARVGIGPGSVVCLTLPSSPDYVVAYVALAKLGAVTAGVNPRFSDRERAAVLDLASPDLVLDADALAALPRSVDEAPPALPPDPDRPVAIVFTSGSSGLPKGAMFRHRHLAAVDAADAGALGWGSGGPMLASTEFAHVGFMTKLPWYLRLGSRLHLLERWRAADALRVVADERMASVGGIAAQFALLLRVPDFDAHDLSSVTTLIAGGAASPAALVGEARLRFGAAYSIRYSSTESGGVGTGTAFDADDEEALETVGRPRPGVEVRIDAPAGEVGEVLLRSPTVMDGYWRDPERTAATIVDGGWLRTGDLGVVDDRGCLRLTGRSSDMYIRGGYNVHPEEVEAVLLDHPGVAAVAVVPKADQVMGEVGVAFVVPVTGTAPTPGLDDLRTFAADRLAAYKLPEDLRVVSELPVNVSEKVDRAALRAAAGATR